MAAPHSPTPDQTAWYLHPGLPRRIVIGLAASLVALVLVDLFLAFSGSGKTPYFPWEKWPAFSAIAGFVGSALLVLVARFCLRPLVKREESYYDAPSHETGGNPDA